MPTGLSCEPHVTPFRLDLRVNRASAGPEPCPVRRSFVRLRPWHIAPLAFPPTAPDARHDVRVPMVNVSCGSDGPGVSEGITPLANLQIHGFADLRGGALSVFA